MYDLFTDEQLERAYMDARAAVMKARAVKGERPSLAQSATAEALANVVIKRHGRGKLDALRRRVDEQAFIMKRKASGDDGVIVEIMSATGSKTSLNISQIGDGEYRATAMFKGCKDWARGTGNTPGAALRDLADKLKGTA